jgi:hypothetical protein
VGTGVAVGVGVDLGVHATSNMARNTKAARMTRFLLIAIFNSLMPFISIKIRSLSRTTGVPSGVAIYTPRI